VNSVRLFFPTIIANGGLRFTLLEPEHKLRAIFGFNFNRCPELVVSKKVYQLIAPEGKFFLFCIQTSLQCTLIGPRSGTYQRSG